MLRQGADGARQRERGKHTLVFELGNRALDGELVANLELVDVLGHLALIIALDEEGELTRKVGGGDGSVGADDGLALGVKERTGGIICGLDDDAGGNG